MSIEETSKDVLERIILLNDECLADFKYAHDIETILLIINDIAQAAKKFIGEEKFTFFLKGPFSQWYPSPFTVNRIIYNCSEQFMMAKKAQFFGDENSLLKIMTTKSPSEQQKLGRKVTNFNLVRWQQRAREIVYKGNYAKFTQNESLKKILIETAGTTLVEVNPNDSIWGIGLSETDPQTKCRNTWKGTNWLGEILTKVRDKIIEEEKSFEI